MLIRYFNERLVTSPRQRMGVAGRECMRWLAQPHILQTTRANFETLLLEIAEYAEEWLTSTGDGPGRAAQRRAGHALGQPQPAASRRHRAARDDAPAGSASPPHVDLPHPPGE